MTPFDLLYLDDIVNGNGLCVKKKQNGSWYVWFPINEYRQGFRVDTETAADEQIALILKRWPIKQVNQRFFVHLLKEEDNYYYFPILPNNKQAAAAGEP